MVGCNGHQYAPEKHPRVRGVGPAGSCFQNGNSSIGRSPRQNLVQARSFAELLEQSIRRYQNRAIETAQIIEELIELAKEMREAGQRGVKLGLGYDEVAFYDALEVNDSAVKVLGEETLKTIARELVETIRRNVTIDWTIKESVRARMRVMVKRILRKYGYPPDKQESATRTVIEQAELFSESWSEDEGADADEGADEGAGESP